MTDKTLTDELAEALERAARWCPNCSGRGTHVEWDGNLWKQVDCLLCAPTRAALTKFTAAKAEDTGT